MESAIGPPAQNRIISIKVPAIALCESRQSDETNRPAANEQKRALVRASVLLNNWSPVTPPIRRVTASTGNNARSAYDPRNEVARSFPPTTSYPLKSVRNRKPSVPSLFSSLNESAVKNTPEKSVATNAIQLTVANRPPPNREEFAPTAMFMVRKPDPITSAARATNNLNQMVLRFRTARRSSRSTIGTRVTRLILPLNRRFAIFPPWGQPALYNALRLVKIDSCTPEPKIIVPALSR